MTKTYLIANRDNAIRQMNYFYADKPMYVFWRSVYRHYQKKIAERDCADLLAEYRARMYGRKHDEEVCYGKGLIANT